MTMLVRLLVADALALAAHGLCMTVGYGYDVGYATLAVAAAAVGTPATLWLGRAHVDAGTLGLAGLAALTLPAWWSGWPIVFGALALTLALPQHTSRRARAGMALAVLAVALGGLAAATG